MHLYQPSNMVAIFDFAHRLGKHIMCLLTRSSHLLSRMKMVKMDTRLKRDFGKDPESLFWVDKNSPGSDLEIKDWKHATQSSDRSVGSDRRLRGLGCWIQAIWRRSGEKGEGSSCYWGSQGWKGQSRESFSSVRAIWEWGELFRLWLGWGHSACSFLWKCIHSLESLQLSLMWKWKQRRVPTGASVWRFSAPGQRLCLMIF